MSIKLKYCIRKLMKIYKEKVINKAPKNLPLPKISEKVFVKNKQNAK